MDEILVDWCGVVRVLRKPDPSDLLWLGEDRSIDNLVHCLSDAWPVPRLVEGLKLVHLVVDVGISKVALGAFA